MNKEQLAITKRIAEIEGLCFHKAENNEFGFVDGSDDIYNPFEWSILGPLMVKYEVDLTRVYHEESQECFVNFCINNKDKLHQTYCDEQEDIPRAILECIIKSQEQQNESSN